MLNNLNRLLTFWILTSHWVQGSVNIIISVLFASKEGTMVFLTGEIKTDVKNTTCMKSTMMQFTQLLREYIKYNHCY